MITCFLTVCSWAPLILASTTRHVELPYYRDHLSYKRLSAGNLSCAYPTQSLCKSILYGYNIVSRIIDTTVTTWKTIPPRCRFFPRNWHRTRSSLHTFAHGFPAGRDPGIGGALCSLQSCILTTCKKTSWLLAILNRNSYFPVSADVCTVRSSDFKISHCVCKVRKYGILMDLIPPRT